MAKITLSAYLERINTEYGKSRELWEEAQKERTAENERFQNIKVVNLSSKGRQEELAKHNEILRGISAKLERIRAEFTRKTDEIRGDADKIFNRLFQYTAGDVDANGVAILQNTTMSATELLEFAESYRAKGNYTMYFMIAERLKSDKAPGMMDESDRKAEAYYNEAKRRRQNRGDHDLLDGYRDICLRGLRDDVWMANGIHKHQVEFYEKFKAGTDAIEADTVSPWESGRNGQGNS